MLRNVDLVLTNSNSRMEGVFGKGFVVKTQAQQHTLIQLLLLEYILVKRAHGLLRRPSVSIINLHLPIQNHYYDS